MPRQKKRFKSREIFMKPRGAQQPGLDMKSLFSSGLTFKWQFQKMVGNVLSTFRDTFEKGNNKSAR
jgi:hypothetical protein